ncbi:MAG: DUF2764 domain-containing protein [Prevotellaceae bacterium]|jgi:hypothetical protein|nr:DUF2764 domain-containing protein [Prevotellaceae bacterium]
MYTYLAAGLTELTFTTDIKGFDYSHICRQMQENITGSDSRLLRLMLMGIEPHRQMPYWYVMAAKSPCRFIREYSGYDRLLRNAQAVAAAEKMNVEPHDYIVGEYDQTTLPEEFELVMAQTDILAREEQIDKLRWQKANEITLFNILDIDYLFAYLAKAAIVDRWMKLDKTKGEAFFRLLISEVKGTFDIRKAI